MQDPSQYRTPTTIDQVRAYVTEESRGQEQSHFTVLLNVAHSNLQVTKFAELRLDVRMTIDEVKQKLYTHCGTRPDAMTVLLRDSTGKVLAELADDNARLGSFSPQTGQTLFVIDSDPNSASANGWLENTDLVEKYKISEEAYNKRENTYRKFKEEKRKQNPAWTLTSENKNVPSIDIDPSLTPKVQIGERAEVFPGGRRGEVRYVGHSLEGLPPGWWIGIRYDEPVGKNNGSVKGVKYFDTEDRHGGFVRPSRVATGNFPPLDDDIDDDEDGEI